MDFIDRSFSVKEIKEMVDNRPPDMGVRIIDYFDICPRSKDYKVQGQLLKDLMEVAKKHKVAFVLHRRVERSENEREKD